MNTRSLLSLATLLAVPVCAQLAPPNQSGVTMGHVHLVVKDMDANKHFWVDMMGGKLVKNGPLDLIQFVGAYIILCQSNERVEPNEGAVVNHVGFVFKDLPAMLGLWKANGIKVEGGNQDLSKVRRLQGFVFTPDGMRVEIFGDPTQSFPVAMDHIHFQVADLPAIRAWYVTTFGGMPGSRLRNSKKAEAPVVFIPGTTLLFDESFSWLQPGTKSVPTKGHLLDHIGFEVRNLEAFSKKLEAQGIKLDVPVHQIPNTNIKTAFLTDPWGTYIELTENLAPK